MMKKLLILMLACMVCSCAAANNEGKDENQPATTATDKQKTATNEQEKAATDEQKTGSLWSKVTGDSVNVKIVEPILSQVISFQLPKPFVPVYDNISQDKHSYTAAFVPEGESVEKWSQMVLTTGYSNLVANKDMTPASLSGLMASQTKASCPATFSSLEFNPTKIGGHEAVAAVMGCGASDMTKKMDSQMALIIFIKGEKDYYSLQWAERGQASNKPLPIDEGKWKARFQKLSPIKLMPLPEPSPAKQK